MSGLPVKGAQLAEWRAAIHEHTVVQVGAAEVVQAGAGLQGMAVPGP